MTDHVSNRPQFSVEQHKRGDKSNLLRGVAALTEMLEMIGREGAKDTDAARILVENEMELRELRCAAIRYMTTWQK